LIVASRHFGDEDAVRVQSVMERGVDQMIRDQMFGLGIDKATEPQHIRPIPELAQKARLCIPIRYNGVLLGYLWLIEERPLTVGDILGWEELGVFALLAKLSPHDVNMAAYPPPLLRLAADRNASMLLSTIETYLDLAGDAQATSQSLHVHRATLYQRLARIEEVSGLSLRNGTDRLTLHLGIKLARLTGQYDDMSKP